MSVDVGLEPELTLGEAVIVLDGLAEPACTSTNYDVTDDGRFLFVEPEAATPNAASEIEFVLVQNWFAELARLVPGD